MYSLRLNRRRHEGAFHFYIKALKILHLVNDLGIGGTTKVVIDLCRLFSADHEIIVVVLSDNIVLTKSDDWPKNVKIICFNYHFDTDYSLTRYLTLFFCKWITYNRGEEIINFIIDHKPDVIHCHLQPRELLIVLNKRIPKTSLLFTDHLVRIKNVTLGRAPDLAAMAGRVEQLPFLLTFPGMQLVPRVGQPPMALESHAARVLLRGTRWQIDAATATLVVER